MASSDSNLSGADGRSQTSPGGRDSNEIITQLLEHIVALKMVSYKQNNRIRIGLWCDMHTQLCTINLEIFIVKNFVINGKMHVCIINSRSRNLGTNLILSFTDSQKLSPQYDSLKTHFISTIDLEIFVLWNFRMEQPGRDAIEFAQVSP